MSNSPISDNLIVLSLVLGALLPVAACGPGLPSDAVAVYDGGVVTAAEARRHLASLDARHLRTDAEIDADSGVAEVLADLAFLEILAEGVNDDSPEQAVLYLDSRARLLMRYYIERTGKRSHEVTDEEALTYYQEHLVDRFTFPEKIKLQHIFLRADRHPPGDLAQQRREILDRLAGGTPFGELVAEYSESGSTSDDGIVGPVFRGRMNAAFEDQVYRLTPGEVGVVRTPQGVHVVEVLELIPSNVEPFEKVKRQIVHAIMDRRNEAERNQVMEALRARYDVVDRSADTTIGPDDIVVRVKERSLTRRELDSYLLLRMNTPGLINRAHSEVRRKLVEELIDTNLLFLDAVDTGLDKEQAFLDRWQESELRRRSGLGTQRRLDDWAKGAGENEVLAYYKENQARFAIPQRFQATFLLMPLGGGPAFELQQTLEELAEKAAAPGIDPAELERRCAESGASIVNMGWTTPLEAARIGPEFQRRLLAMDEPGSSGLFMDQGGLYVILLRALEDRRSMTTPIDLDLILARYVVLRRHEILAEVKQQTLAERHFEVLSTTLFELTDVGP